MFLLFDAYKRKYIVHTCMYSVTTQTKKKKKKNQSSKLLHGAPALMDRDANFNPDSTARFSQHNLSALLVSGWEV